MFKRRNPLSYWQKWRQFLWPREGWARAFSYTWLRTLRLNGSAHSIALGLAAGAFISACPLLGTHFIWAGLIAWMFGGNIIASAIGTWIGNPLTFPFIWVATFKSGHFILGSTGNIAELPDLSFSLLVEAPASTLLPVVGPMMIGMFPVGLALAIATYYPSLWFVDAYQMRRQRKLALKREKSEKQS